MTYAETNGIRAYYEVSGDGRPLVLIEKILNLFLNKYPEEGR
jgi:hypothetical protein